MPRAIDLAAALIVLGAANAFADVSVTDAWVRATVPGQKAGAAYFTIRSSADAKLVGAATPVAKSAEIHASRINAGIAEMEALDSLALPAGKPVSFAPGGHHLMLLGLAKPLAAGDKVRLTLTVEEKGKRRTLEVDAPVKALTR